MFTLQEFGELRCLWLIFTQDIKSCYHYIEKYGKRCMTKIDPKRMRQYRKRAIENVSLLHYEALTRHDRA